MEKSKNTVTKEMVDNEKKLPFTKMNYLLVIGGILLIALGMILMIGGGSSDPDVFNEKMFNFQRLY